MQLNMNTAIGIGNSDKPFLQAQWPAPANVKTLITTRNGGVSGGRYGSLNIALHVGDTLENVQRNRQIVQQQIGVPVVYLNQVHGNNVVRAAEYIGQVPQADAAVDETATVACAVMSADCLPILLCNTAGTTVAAVHAGWRGLAGGVVRNTVAAMNTPPAGMMAYLGPAIGRDAFEVGQDVYDAFCIRNPAAEAAFEPIGGNQYLADIYCLARLLLQNAGVDKVYGGGYCTVLERDTFFSYRRSGITGRMASVIWLEKQ